MNQEIQKLIEESNRLVKETQKIIESSIELLDDTEKFFMSHQAEGNH